MSAEPSGSVFSEQLALQITALVQEVAADYERQLQRQILAEQKISAALRDEVQQLRKRGTAHLSSDATACPITVKVDSPPAPPSISGDLELPRLQKPVITEDGTLLHRNVSKSERSVDVDAVQPGESGLSLKTGVGEESIKLTKSVKTTFHSLDRRKVGRLCASDLKDLVQRHRSEGAGALEARISRTIEAVNRAQPELCSDLRHVSELSYLGYKYILSARDLDENNFSHEIALTFRNLREVCLNSTTEQMVANEMDLRRQETFGNLVNRRRVLVQERFLAPMSGVVIAVNALCIGLSLDVASQWLGWHIMELCFAVFFFIELLATISLNGFIEVYFGDDWRWNLFDTMVVFFALADALLWVLDVLGAISQTFGDSLSTVSIMRLARLVRVTRVMRLVRLDFAMFKDLKIMMNGIQGGINTLFWASILLLGMIYTVGIIIRMLMQNLNLLCTLDNSSCSPSERALVNNYSKLFSSTPRCMLTVFRCLTDGCSAADGTPLVLYFWDWQGVLFVICYTVLVVFVLFVVFNLISALFVEKTLEYTKQDTDKRRHARYKEDCRVARELKQVILKICARKKNQQTSASKLTTAQSNVTLMMTALGFRRSSRGFGEDDLDLNDLRLSISKSDFETIFEERETKSLLRDLDISVTNFSKLFDIFDANQDGKLDIAELADGFMRLRGPADKGDTVSINLMVKAIQKSIAQLQSSQEELRQFVLQTRTCK